MLYDNVFVKTNIIDTEVIINMLDRCISLNSIGSDIAVKAIKQVIKPILLYDQLKRLNSRTTTVKYTVLQYDIYLSRV